MNKQSILNLGLGAAVVVLFVLHFSGGKGKVEAEVISEASSSDSATIVGLTDDSTNSGEVALASTSKLAYFQLDVLGEKCPYLKRKMDALISKEEALYGSAEAKQRELEKWYMNKQQELEEYDKKKMLVPALVEQAQMEFAKKQQEMQVELQREEKSLVKAKEDYLRERAGIITEAVEKLNEKAGWDYVLVDNPEVRIVIPFNEKNNITGNLAKIINQKHK